MNVKQMVVGTLILLGSTTALMAQQNEFKIGMFGGAHLLIDPNTNLPYTTLKSPSGFNTSNLNVLSSDGFNITIDYNATDFMWIQSFNVLKGKLNLVKLNNMMFMSNLHGWYKPNLPPLLPSGQLPCPVNNPLTGTNVYAGNGTTRINYNDLFSQVFNNPTYLFYYLGTSDHRRGRLRTHI